MWRIGLLGGILVLGGVVLTLRPAVPATPPAQGPEVPYMGNPNPHPDRPAPHFNYAGQFVATPGNPLNLPPPSTPLAPGETFAGVEVHPPPTLPTRVRTDGELRAVVEQELAKITTRRSEARLRYFGTPEPSIFDRYRIQTRDPRQTVIVVVECDCDAGALLPHADNMKWLIWVLHRQSGSQLIATEGSPLVQDLLGDPTIPTPALDRMRAAAADAGVPNPPGRPAGLSAPLLPPPFAP
jgi:hypothetical protein